MLLQIHIDDFPVLVDSSPKVVLLTSNPYEHLIQKVGITEPRMSAPETSSKLRPEFVDPEPNGFVADGYITLSEKVLDISDAEIEPIVKLNGMPNPVSIISETAACGRLRASVTNTKSV